MVGCACDVRGDNGDQMFTYRRPECAATTFVKYSNILSDTFDMSHFVACLWVFKLWSNLSPVNVCPSYFQIQSALHFCGFGYACCVFLVAQCF